MMSVNQASSYHLQQQQHQNQHQQFSKSTRPLQTASSSSNHQHPQHPIITYGVQQQQQQQQQHPYQGQYSTWSNAYAGTDPYYYHPQSQQYQRMWYLVRRIFPAEENLIKAIFAIHLVFLAYFVLNYDVHVNNGYLKAYNDFFIHLLFGLFTLCLFWALLAPTDYNPVDLAQLVQAVSIGVDCFLLYKLFSRYPVEGHVEEFVFWILLMLVRLLTLILLRKLWAGRVAAALDVYGLNAQSAYQLTPSVNATQKMTSPSPILPSSSARQPVNFTVGSGGNRAPSVSREAYLYEASLNA